MTTSEQSLPFRSRPQQQRRSSVKLLLSVLVNEDVRRFITYLSKHGFSGCGSKGGDSWAAALLQTAVRCHVLEALLRLPCIQRKTMQSWKLKSLLSGRKKRRGWRCCLRLGFLRMERRSHPLSAIGFKGQSKRSKTSPKGSFPTSIS